MPGDIFLSLKYFYWIQCYLHAYLHTYTEFRDFSAKNFRRLLCYSFSFKLLSRIRRHFGFFICFFFVIAFIKTFVDMMCIRHVMSFLLFFMICNYLSPRQTILLWNENTILFFTAVILNLKMLFIYFWLFWCPYCRLIN